MLLNASNTDLAKVMMTATSTLFLKKKKLDLHAVDWDDCMLWMGDDTTDQ